MSLEGYLEKGVCFSLLAKGWQTRERVGRPVVAKVCKSLNMSISISNNTMIPTTGRSNIVGMWL